MGARFRTWWQQVKQYRAAILVVAIILVGVLALIIVGYRFDWTGFNGNNKSGKTLWDWLQLLIIPLALAVIALLFNLANSRTERQIAKRRYEQDQQIAEQRYEQDQSIALDKQREDLLQTYLDRMSELLLKEGLGSSSVKPEVRNVARVRTITILFQLDTRRNDYVFTFLRESGLIKKGAGKSIVSFNDADLYGGVDLSRVNLSDADFSGAYLANANLSGAFLRGATLIETTLSGADLSGAHLLEADLNGADLARADLSEAKITDEQLNRAKSLKGATMPDGSIHP